MPTLRRAYALPEELEDAVSAALWEAGTLGCQVTALDGARLRIDAYFPPGSPDPLAAWSAVEVLGDGEEVPDGDWLDPWRRQARPFELGSRFRVDPREPEEVDADGGPPSPLTSATPHPSCRRLLRLPARAAFGVGSHASTRLAVELIEELPLAGGEVLDVGTGTGVLAFVALHLGARRAVAFDVDPAAVCAARDNARRNGFTPLVFAGTGAALGPNTRFRWALVNVVPELILPVLPAIATRVVGGFVLSGILAGKGDAVAAAVAELGFVETGRLTGEEWVALRMERATEREGER